MKALGIRDCQTERARRWRSAALPVLLVCQAAAAPPAHADLIRLTLYEKPAESDLVVRGKVVRGDLPRAEVAVEEVLKGAYDQPTLEVVFRLDSFARKAWEERIVFHTGEPVLLFLKPFRKENGERPFLSRFSLVRGAQGKMELPAEGSRAILEAVRRFIRVQGETDIAKIGEELRTFLSDPNPLVMEAGLQQVSRLRLGEPRTTEAILPILSHPVADFRRDALRLLGQIFEDHPSRGAGLEDEDHVVSLILTRAREDEDVEVRIQAVRALGTRGKRDVLSALEQIAQTDPAQQVRLQAELAALDLSRDDAAGAPPLR